MVIFQQFTKQMYKNKVFITIKCPAYPCKDMEEKLAAFHGYRLPVYKRDGPGQPRIGDPCPTFLLKTPAQRLPPTSNNIKTLRDWVLLEDELLHQRRGQQITTTPADSSHPEWTPEQRQEFLKLLKKRRHEEVEDLTVCDADIHLASLFRGSQLGNLIGQYISYFFLCSSSYRISLRIRFTKHAPVSGK